MRAKSASVNRSLPNLRLASWAERDLRLARRMYRGAQDKLFVRILIVASWLGDGIFWYALIAAMVLAGGTDGRDAAAHMALAGLFNLAIYKWLKRSVSRKRPCDCYADLRAVARPLDTFSFPSGHVLHATTFTIILFSHYPGAGLALLPVIVLIALSRVALGLHYPSDVVAGALIGGTVAALMLALY